MRTNARFIVLLAFSVTIGLQAQNELRAQTFVDTNFAALASEDLEERTCVDSKSLSIAVEWLSVLKDETVNKLTDPVVKNAALAAKSGVINDFTKRAARRMLVDVVTRRGIVDQKTVERTTTEVRREFRTIKIPTLGAALRSEGRGSEVTIGAVAQSIPSNRRIECGRAFREYLAIRDSRIDQMPTQVREMGIPWANALQQTRPGTDEPSRKFLVPGEQCGVAAKDHFTPLPTGRLTGTYDSIGFPEVVFLEYESGKTCSGTLLSPSWVLTAAHCVLENNVPDNYVSLTVWLNRAVANLYQDKPSSARVKKGRVFVLPQYRELSTKNVIPENKAPYDIALIELDTAFDVHLQSTVSKAQPPVVFLATLASFGTNLSDKKDQENINNKLDVGWLNVTANNKMVQWVGYDPSNNSAIENSVACRGDSGGPIFLNAWKSSNASVIPNTRPTIPAVGCQDERRQLVGVTSFIKPVQGGSLEKETPPCVQSTRGGGATVAQHLKWICETTRMYCGKK